MIEMETFRDDPQFFYPPPGQSPLPDGSQPRIPPILEEYIHGVIPSAPIRRRH